MKRLVVAGVVALAAVVLLLAVRLPGTFEPADAFVERWLDAVAGTGSSDSGWSQMDESSRERFGNDAYAFQAAAAAEDWSRFQWEVEDPYQLESWLWSIRITVIGGLAATPDFLRNERLVGPWCVDDSAPGISLQVVQQWPWSERTLGPGGFTGSAERALIAGACAPSASVPPPQFVSGGDMAWTGHQLAVWNWTTLPLFLLTRIGIGWTSLPVRRSAWTITRASSRCELRPAM
jgi:hypothetical protein